MIHREDKDSVTVLRLTHGKVNALDIELLEALTEQLEDAAAHAGTRALVFTGNASTFSAGVDLFRVIDGGTPYLERFLPALSTAFEKLFEFPRPVVAAINGHAIAGGCVLATACDYRVMAAGVARIGVPELHVGVPFPTMALEIMRFAVPNEHLQEIVYSGRTLTCDEALEYRLIDALVAPDELLEQAHAQAVHLTSIPPQTFTLSKHQLHAPAMEQIKRGIAQNEPKIHDIWTATETRETIERYLQRTLKKKA